MAPIPWAKVHGAVVHFPVALSLCSAALDATGFFSPGKPIAREFHCGGCVLMISGAVGSMAAVVSGLFLAKGEVLGHDLLRWHHLMAWPAFALLVGLATWRGLAGLQPSRRALAWYLGCAVLAAGLVAATGYWGGEMLVQG